MMTAAELASFDYRPIESASRIRGTSRDPATGDLYVYFENAAYRFVSPPPWMRGILHAGITDGSGNSSGRFFNRFLRGHFAVPVDECGKIEVRS